VGAREEILAALRRAGVPAAPRPELGALGAPAADLAARFADAVATVGGACVRAADREGARRAIAELPAVQAARRVVSREAGELRPLDGIDVAVLDGVLGVAENGAVWVESATLPHPALFVIPEHLVLVVEARELVADMHAACARVAGRDGVFIAGPSKTADIEQALVIGAHGPRSCTVVVVG
jgi:L-lactate dehydrogenase complex protein LldG